MVAESDLPPTVLNVMVEKFDDAIPLLGVCAGHEDKRWRFRALSNDLFEWAMDWILPHEELAGLTHTNAYRLMSKAIGRIYTTEKYERRGEIGELLLHIVLRRFLGSQRAISRIYFKDAANDTVKGFDAIHVVAHETENGSEELELWLGEAKFFKDSSSAIGAVLEELEAHLDSQYLRSEFAAISDKIEPGWKHGPRLRSLLKREVSLDEVFERVVIPVFITFNSDITGRHPSTSPDYKREMIQHMEIEWDSFRSRFQGKTLPREVKVQLILLPMHTKADLISSFDERLKSWQAATRV